MLSLMRGSSGQVTIGSRAVFNAGAAGGKGVIVFQACAGKEASLAMNAETPGTILAEGLEGPCTSHCPQAVLPGPIFWYGMSDSTHRISLKPELPPGEDAHGDRQFATTLQRGLQVLACFSAAAPILTNKEIAERTGLPRPTVSRLTYTLTLLGYLQHHPHIGKYGKYELGNAVLSLAHPLLANIAVRQVARLPMKELADHAHGWVSLGIRERLNMVYIETARSTRSRSVRPDIGQTFPIVVSAMGRAHLAALPAREREELINQLQVKTPDLWATYADRVEQGLQDYIERGFCVGRGDYDPNTHTVAVPLRRPGTNQVMVFNCAVRVDDLAPGALDNDLGPRLAQMVRAIESALDME